MNASRRAVGRPCRIHAVVGLFRQRRQRARLQIEDVDVAPDVKRQPRAVRRVLWKPVRVAARSGARRPIRRRSSDRCRTPAPARSDMNTIFCPSGDHAGPTSRRAVGRQPPHVRSIGIHHVHVEVAARVIGLVGDLAAVGRPGRIAFGRGRVRQLPLAGTVGVDDKQIRRLAAAFAVEDDCLLSGDQLGAPSRTSGAGLAPPRNHQPAAATAATTRPTTSGRFEPRLGVPARMAARRCLRAPDKMLDDSWCPPPPTQG